MHFISRQYVSCELSSSSIGVEFMQSLIAENGENGRKAELKIDPISSQTPRQRKLTLLDRRYAIKVNIMTLIISLPTVSEIKSEPIRTRQLE